MHSTDAFYLALFCFATLPVGFLLGWLVCSQAGWRTEIVSYPQKEKKTERRSVDPEALLQHAETAFRSFCAVTDGLQHDVGVHGEKIAAASTSLANESPEDIKRAVSRIVEANAWLQDQLVTAQATIRQQSVELEQRMLEANSDGLTGIGNRRAFDLELERQLARWQRYSSTFTLVMFDIDHFKGVNDRHGHPAGDAVLRATAEIIKCNLREVDFAARFGGEEFAAILVETDHHSGLIVADRIRKAIAGAQIPWEDKMLSVTVSVGVAALSRLDDAQSLIQRADEALYIAKREGRNRTALMSYTPKSDEIGLQGPCEAPQAIMQGATDQWQLVPAEDES